MQRRVLESFAIAVTTVMLSVVTIAVGQPPEPPALVLRGARIYQSLRVVIDRGTIIIKGDRIAYVGTGRGETPPAGAREIDCRGLIVTAGFINSHVHLTPPVWANAKNLGAAALGRAFEEWFTRYGVTMAVDASSDLQNTSIIRKRLDSGEVDGPRLLTAGIGIFPTAGAPYYAKEAMPAAILRLAEPDSVESAAAFANRNLDGGADVIKIFTGTRPERDSERVMNMPLPMAKAVVDAAHRRGALVLAHPTNSDGVEVALESGVDVIAHTVESGYVTDDQLKRMKKQRVVLVPTLAVYGGTRTGLDELHRFAGIGGTIAFGTDLRSDAEANPTPEYELMRQAGLSYRDILASLTTNPAKTFLPKVASGTVTAGAQADLVVLGGDPATSVQALADVRATIRSGRLIYDCLSQASATMRSAPCAAR